jgi:hypothetical protein
MPRWLPVALLAGLLPDVAAADPGGRCPEIVARLGAALADVECFESSDLTTKGTLTTPPNDSVAGLPAFAFTPITDRGVIAPVLADQTPIAEAVPGIQLEARVADDPAGEARFLLRLPDNWNGKLVVAGASGTRSEFNGDLAWSDYVVQQGYAYASQNKGILNLRFSTAADPLACRLNPDSPLFVHFYVNDPAASFAGWQDRMVEAARLAREGVKARYGRHPRHVYAVGTSNGGYQVRRAIEEAPGLFDGGVDWEGTFVDPGEHNLLVQLPAAIRHYPAYRDSGFDPASAAAQAIRAAGYPPDLVQRDPATGAVTASYWRNHWGSYWEVTQCQWQKRLDPAYDTYGAGTGAYDYLARAATTGVDDAIRAFETTGKIKRPLVTVAGTMDALLPVEHHSRAYAAKVDASRRGNDAHRHAQHRYYEVQNGSHIETYRATFPQLELIQPHAQRAFDLLVAHVEGRAPLPPDQCIPRGGEISQDPAQPGACAALLAE